MVTLRKQPFPYKFMVAISSDDDEVTMAMRENYQKKFRQYGLDVGDTVQMVGGYGDSNRGRSNAYPVLWNKVGGSMDAGTWNQNWSTVDQSAMDLILKYSMCGWIDGLQSWGSFDNSAGWLSDANALANTPTGIWEVYTDKFRELGLGRFINHWISHHPALYDINVGTMNLANFSPKMNQGRLSEYGDVEGSRLYHTDLTVARDCVRYVWDDEGGWGTGYGYGTQTVGAYSLYGVPVKQPIDFGPEWQKNDYASTNPGPKMSMTEWDADGSGGGRYQPFLTHPDLIYPVTLRDGRKLWGFWRSNGRNSFDGGAMSLMNQLLTIGHAQRWEQAKTEGGFFPMYCHLGFWDTMWTDQDYINLMGATEAADLLSIHPYATVERLAAAQEDGDVLVSRLSRMLDYALARNHVKWTVSSGDIHVTHIEDECFGDFIPEVRQLRGVTFLTDNQNAGLFIGTTQISESEIDRNWDSVAGKWAVGIKWYQADTTDYSAMTLAQVEAKFSTPGTTLYENYTAPQYVEYVGPAEYDFVATLSDVTINASGSVVLDLSIAGSAVSGSSVIASGSVQLDFYDSGSARVTSVSGGSAILDMAVSGIASVASLSSSAYDFVAIFKSSEPVSFGINVVGSSYVEYDSGNPEDWRTDEEYYYDWQADSLPNRDWEFEDGGEVLWQT